MNLTWEHDSLSSINLLESCRLNNMNNFTTSRFLFNIVGTYNNTVNSLQQEGR